MDLVSNWKRLHRSTTVLLGLILTIFEALQIGWSQFSALFTERQSAAISLTLAVLIIVLRYWRQGSVSPPAA